MKFGLVSRQMVLGSVVEEMWVLLDGPLLVWNRTICNRFVVVICFMNTFGVRSPIKKFSDPKRIESMP